MASNNFASIHNVRSQVYNFLYKVFVSYPAAQGFYENISSSLDGLSTISSQSDNADMQEGVDGLATFMNELNSLKGKEKDDALLKVQQNHAMLLCLETSVYADESYYTSKDKKFRQESYDKILQVYSKYGFALSEDITESEEHISIELAFMSKLADMASTAEDGYDELLKEQIDFHSNHIDVWVYEFIDKVVSFPIADENLYKNIAKFMKGFLQEDKQLLTELVAQ